MKVRLDGLSVRELLSVLWTRNCYGVGVALPRRGLADP